MTYSVDQITIRDAASLKAAHRNARTHNRKQIRKIADAIERFGFVSPIIVDRELRIVAGNGRLAAAKLLKLEQVPTISLDHLSAEELRALAIADNHLASLAGWDKEVLAVEIAELEIAIPSLDLTVTGFEVEQIALLRDVAGSKRQARCKEPPLPPSGPPVTLAGDLWLIGDHRLLCGDALDPNSYRRLLAGALADLVITDPPYNVRIDGHVSGSDRHREFAMASGEMSRPEFQRFLSTMCRQLARFSRSGSLHYLFMDWRSISDLIGAGEEHFAELLNILVWVKPLGGMGSFYRSRHEMAALFRSGEGRHINNVSLGASGRNRTNVWEYPGVSGFGAERHLGDLHPTVKNRLMIAEAIRDASHEKDIVLDPFGGSGTTLMAAQDTGRRAAIIEIDPAYCDACVRRGIAEGLQVTLDGSNETFASTQASRS